MQSAKKMLALLILATLMPFPAVSNAGNRAVTSVHHGRTARVAQVQGLVWVSVPGKQLRELRKGDLLVNGNRVRTEKQSRIEIQPADGSAIRFDAQTAFILTVQEPAGTRKHPQLDIRLVQGEAWANTAPSLSGRDRFTMSTRTAVAWSRGTVYRLSLDQDESLQIKVYTGEVMVESTRVSAAEETDIGGPAHLGKKPPQTHMVGPMRQIIVHPDGGATAPFRFAPTPDENEWVRWNRSKDKAGLR